ncbi:sensor histidine kinase [Galactobacter valiniphilus]|uniref:histidine kinase n=1 Tax=Galactobacter valiniphilus TaxID=2676122 RepID=A0A399J9G5_9MICC|nr:HAMP domain-containing sensor histidine kinase [Galactobacter valiniphilus]RII42205.1 sensor histidine kinase [Galactobacter valiniphilus]
MTDSVLGAAHQRGEGSGSDGHRLRVRLVALTVLSVLVAVAFLGVLVHVLVAGAEDRRLRDAAVDQLNEALTVMSETGVNAFNSSIDDPGLPRDVADAARAGEVVTRRHSVQGHDVVTAASPISAAPNSTSVLSVNVSAEPSEELIRQLDRALLIAGAASTVVMTALAAFVTTRLTRRLARAASAARALPARIAEGGSVPGIAEAIGAGRAKPDEVDRLVEAVDTMAGTLRARLETEQRFTADLAHELRTPLTGLVLAASLLDDERPAQLVRERTERLRVLVEDLLEVSRFEAGADTAELEPTDLLRAVRSSVHRAREEGVPWAETVTVEDRGGEWALLEQRRLDRIVSNLIKNAAAHGALPLHVWVEGTSVVVEDEGPGFPAEILAAGPSRFVTKGGGWGLGLTIARGQSRVQGARFELGTGAAGGARVRLRFAAADEPVRPEGPRAQAGSVA